MTLGRRTHCLSLRLRPPWLYLPVASIMISSVALAASSRIWVMRFRSRYDFGRALTHGSGMSPSSSEIFS